MFRLSFLIATTLMIFFACASCKEKKAPMPPLPQPRSKTVPVGEENSRTPNLDKSPMDMIYYPVDYPVLKMSGKTEELPVARVIYSRPEKGGRAVFGQVVRYGQYWRLGANEGTEIEFFRNVTILGTKVRKGRYIIYCIPYENKWNIRLNDDLYSWGLKIHGSKDVYSFEIVPQPSGRVYEVFTMEFTPDEKGARLLMAWDNVMATLPVSF